MQCDRCSDPSILFLLFDEGWICPVHCPEEGALGPGEEGACDRQSFLCCVHCLQQPPNHVPECL